MTDKLEIAYFAMGCFWGAQKLFYNTAGVVDSAVGYMGGHTTNPTYEEVCTGKTNHAETVCVKYDPNLVSYRKLLEIFFTHHNSTTPNQQGGDIGTQYRSVIFTTSPTQSTEAQAIMETLTPAIIERYGQAPVTEINTSEPMFWPAEEYHQFYLQKNPNGYCSIAANGITCG